MKRRSCVALPQLVDSCVELHPAVFEHYYSVCDLAEALQEVSGKDDRPVFRAQFQQEVVEL